MSLVSETSSWGMVNCSKDLSSLTPVNHVKVASSAMIDACQVFAPDLGNAAPWPVSLAGGHGRESKYTFASSPPKQRLVVAEFESTLSSVHVRQSATRVSRT